MLDLPLGDAGTTAEWAVMVNILGGPADGSASTSASPRRWPLTRAAKIHTYGKAPRPGRKVGHVNVVGDDLDDVAYQARAAASVFLD